MMVRQPGPGRRDERPMPTLSTTPGTDTEVFYLL